MRAWRISAEAPEYSANDLSGLGAKKSGGRWNRPGTEVVYAASNLSLACLETVVHFNSGSLPLNRYVVRIDIPDDIFAAAVLAVPPVGWDSEPAGKASLDFGEEWLASRASLLLVVPSVIVPEELNLLINPKHPDVNRVVATALRKFTYDGRIRSGK